MLRGQIMFRRIIFYYNNGYRVYKYMTTDDSRMTIIVINHLMHGDHIFKLAFGRVTICDVPLEFR